MPETSPAEMRARLDAQRAAFLAARPEPLSVRRDRIDRCLMLLLDHRDALAAAMGADFGQRSATQGLMTDVMPSVTFAKYCRHNLKRWARTERRAAPFPLGLLGARAELRYEPKGVIGIVSPWNFPVGLTFGPLVQVLAAGNRAMLKPSEYTERTSALIAELVERHFAPDEVAVVTGGPAVGEAFCALPFDHLVFTGATAVGRHVMRAAADNLVPVTLELGGKSPVILGQDADVAHAGARVAAGKMLNAGQICLAPDYMIVPEAKRDAVVAAVGDEVGRMYPKLLGNDDYAAVVNARHRDRLRGLIDDATGKGANAIEVNPGGEDFASGNANKLPLTILTGVDDTMQVMREEIFGPVLPVMTYRAIDEAIDYVNAHDRPLGLYFFGDDAAERERVLTRTLSGGVTVNDVIFHISAETLPFGGVGGSGMGAYHGPEGFKEFSHARAVYRQPKLDVARIAGFKPPYGKPSERTLKMQLKR